MKSFDVIVQRENGGYRGVVPDLPSITVEGSSPDDVFAKAKVAIEEFFATAEVRTVSVDVPAEEYRPYTNGRDLLRYMSLYSREPTEMDREYWAELEAERQRQREEAARAGDNEALGYEAAARPIAPYSRDPRVWIETAGMFKGDAEAMLQHIEEIEAERRREREALEREYDLLEAQAEQA
jgi:predicted RNase H-like HicB family nuclease